MHLQRGHTASCAAAYVWQFSLLRTPRTNFGIRRLSEFHFGLFHLALAKCPTATLQPVSWPPRSRTTRMGGVQTQSRLISRICRTSPSPSLIVWGRYEKCFIHFNSPIDHRLFMIRAFCQRIIHSYIADIRLDWQHLPRPALHEQVCVSVRSWWDAVCLLPRRGREQLPPGGLLPSVPSNVRTGKVFPRREG